MAITDNIFTAEELSAAIQSNPALMEVMKDTAKTGGFFVYKKDEFDTFVQGVKTEAINETTSKIYNQIDQDVAALTGATKGQEKTYDFVKRVINESKAKITTLEGEKTNLETQIKNGGDKTLQTKYDALEQEHKKLKDETLPSLQSKLKTAKIESLIADASRDLKFNPNYDEAVVGTLLDVARNKMLTSAKITENDEVQFLDAEGKPYMNGINVASAKDVFVKFLPEKSLDTGKHQPGAGTNPPGTATKHKNAEGKEIVISSEIKTKVQLHEFLVKQGLSTTSKEFIEIDKEYASLPTV